MAKHRYVVASFLFFVLLLPSVVSAATLDRIREEGVLRIGVRSDAAPFSYRDSLGEASGFIVNLCRAAAKNIRAWHRFALRRLNGDFVPPRDCRFFDPDVR